MLKRQRGFLELPMLIGLIVAVVALGGGLLLAKKQYDDGKIKIGDARARTELQPKLEACALSLNTARSNVKGLQTDLAGIKALNAADLATRKEAEAKEAAKLAANTVELGRLRIIQKAQQTEIVALRARVNGPPAATPAQSCAEATSILHQYAVDATSGGAQ